MLMRGANLLIESLKHEDVEHIFGVQGGAAMPIFDALYEAKGIQLITMRHEQGLRMLLTDTRVQPVKSV